MAKTPKFESLEGRLLVSTVPAGEFFHRAVVLLTSHTQDFAEGLVVNHPISAGVQKTILEQLDITPKLTVETVYQGGPVDLTHGSVLHSSEYHTPDTEVIADGICLTQTHQILMDIANHKAPEHFLFCVGHAAWKAHQLEEEIMGNIWIPVPAQADIVFMQSNEKKWQAALATLNVDATRLSFVAGKA